MTSWRDFASQQAQDDFDELLNATLPFAQEMLAKHGEFFPYGAAITSSGDVKQVAGDPGEGEQPRSVDVLAILVQGFEVERDVLRATALVSDVQLADSDAVRVEPEHREGHALKVILPYKKKRLRRGVEYGALSAGSADRHIWLDDLH